MGDRFRNLLKNFLLVYIGFFEVLMDDYNFWEKLKWKVKIYILSLEFCSVIFLLLYFFFGY